MFGHISVVHQASVVSMGISGVFQIGDTNQMELKSRALAVHRETSTFLTREGNLEGFAIFTDDKITIPSRKTNVKMTVINENPFIEVDCVKVYSLLNAACWQIGSVDYVFSNARIKQIRQFITEEPRKE